ncbi:hypothetical protein G9A89_000955 [Geosiphon pyriformis]|nr:hypothetical protein G9A89_000955 [Geosiphon pyriformis]
MASANTTNGPRQFPTNILTQRENGFSTSHREQLSRPQTPTTPTRSNTNGQSVSRPPLVNSPSSTPRKKSVKDFELGRTLGEGSYSTVVAARDRGSGKEYAIKILDKKHIIKEKKVKYVNIEKNTLNKMCHPGIHFTTADKYYIIQLETGKMRQTDFVLDHAKNGELLTFIKKLGSFDLVCTQFYAGQILSAIDYMHNQGIIHRDLKPENILLDEKMHIKVTDFGTAKILEKNTDGEEDDRANSFVGTAEYVSPELLKEKAACKSSDFWALGCIVYQLIAGRPPFKGSNEYMTFQKIVNLEYDFPEGFPDIARDLVQKLLVLKPAERLGAGGRAGVAKLKSHPFFEDIEWDSIWHQPAPRLLPYLPPNPHYDKEELRTPSATYLQNLSTSSSGDNTSSPMPTGLKQRDPFRLESWASGAEGALDKLDPVKAQKLEEQKRTSAQWIPFLVKSELILRAGPINKRKGLFSKRRLLILTDFPRLIYVDQEKMSQKGEIYWSSRMVVELKNKKNFFIHTPRKTYYFEDPNATAQEWVKKINELSVENYGRKRKLEKRFEQIQCIKEIHLSWWLFMGDNFNQRTIFSNTALFGGFGRELFGHLHPASSAKQKGDLGRKKQHFLFRFPTYELFLAQNGQVRVVSGVVTYRDPLWHLTFDLLQYISFYSAKLDNSITQKKMTLRRKFQPQVAGEVGSRQPSKAVIEAMDGWVKQKVLLKKQNGITEKKWLKPMTFQQKRLLFHDASAI